jgi:hypothetical protein
LPVTSVPMFLMRIEAILGRNYIKACRTVKGEIQSPASKLAQDASTKQSYYSISEGRICAVQPAQHRSRKSLRNPE